MGKVMKSYRMYDFDIRTIDFLKEQIAKHPDVFYIDSSQYNSDSEIISLALIHLLLDFEKLTEDHPDIKAEFLKFRGPKTF